MKRFQIIQKFSALLSSPPPSPETVPSKMTHDLLISRPQGSTSILSRLKANAHTFLETPVEGSPGALV